MENSSSDIKKNQMTREEENEQRQNSGAEPEKDNLGLDADGSSRWSEGEKSLNDDNDRVTGNPDGEDDDHDTTALPGHSPLMDK